MMRCFWALWFIDSSKYRSDDGRIWRPISRRSPNDLIVKFLQEKNMKSVKLALAASVALLIGANGVAHARSTPDEQACLQAVSTKANNGDVEVVDTIPSGRGRTTVMIEVGSGANRAQWRCRISDGYVDDVMFVSEGRSERRGRESDYNRSDGDRFRDGNPRSANIQDLSNEESGYAFREMERRGYQLIRNHKVEDGGTQWIYRQKDTEQCVEMITRASRVAYLASAGDGACRR
jgi:hypothetical protein